MDTKTAFRRSSRSTPLNLDDFAYFAAIFGTFLGCANINTNAAHTTKVTKNSFIVLLSLPGVTAERCKWKSSYRFFGMAHVLFGRYTRRVYDLTIAVGRWVAVVHFHAVHAIATFDAWQPQKMRLRKKWKHRAAPRPELKTARSWIPTAF